MEIVVRVFVYGLLLVVPNYGADGERTTKDDSLALLLVDSRFHSEVPQRHTPELLYCELYEGNGDCLHKNTKRWELAKRMMFETLEFAWLKSPEVEIPLGGGVEWWDPVTKLPDGIDWYPKSAGDGWDFDWTVRIKEVVGSGIQVATRKECLVGGAMDCRELVARVFLDEGEIKTCDFVRRDKEEVAGFHFAPASPHSSRAMAEVLVLELRRPLKDIKGIRVTGSSGTKLDLMAAGTFGRDCDAGGDGIMDRCIDLALTNLPPKTKRLMIGEHFAMYYPLLDMVPKPTQSAVPIWDLGKGKKPLEHFCSIPFKEPLVPLAMDRPICPIATP